jgi:hypothetical protein
MRYRNHDCNRANSPRHYGSLAGRKASDFGTNPCARLTKARSACTSDRIGPSQVAHPDCLVSCHCLCVPGAHPRRAALTCSLACERREYSMPSRPKWTAGGAIWRRSGQTAASLSIGVDLLRVPSIPGIGTRRRLFAGLRVPGGFGATEPPDERRRTAGASFT